MSGNATPLERDEQIALVQWLELHRLKFTSIPNSTYTTSHKQKSINHATGLRAGFPDIIVLVKPTQSHDGRGYMLAIEMKRQKGGVVSPEQRQWIAAINGLGCDQVESVVAHGAAEAIEYLISFVSPKMLTGSPF